MISIYSLDIIRPVVIGGIPEEAFQLVGIALNCAIGFAFYLAG
jgi:hypothetical protein